MDGLHSEIWSPVMTATTASETERRGTIDSVHGFETKCSVLVYHSLALQRHGLHGLHGHTCHYITKHCQVPLGTAYVAGEKSYDPIAKCLLACQKLSAEVASTSVPMVMHLSPQKSPTYVPLTSIISSTTL